MLRFGLRQVYQVRGWTQARPRLRSAEGERCSFVPGAATRVPLDPAGFLSISAPNSADLVGTWGWNPEYFQCITVDVPQVFSSPIWKSFLCLGAVGHMTRFNSQTSA